MTTLPSDLDVARQLVAVRAAVIEATHHVRSPKRSTRYRTTRKLIIAARRSRPSPPARSSSSRRARRHRHRRRLLSSPSLDQRADPRGPGDRARPRRLRSSSAAGVAATTCSTTANNNDPDPNDGTSPVPPLVACTRPDGARGGLPSREERHPAKTSARLSASRIGTLTRGSRVLRIETSSRSRRRKKGGARRS